MKYKLAKLNCELKYEHLTVGLMNSHFEEKYYRKCFIYIIILTIREGYYGLKTKKKNSQPINPGNKTKYLFFISTLSFLPMPSVP